MIILDNIVDNVKIKRGKMKQFSCLRNILQTDMSNVCILMMMRMIVYYHRWEYQQDPPL